MYVNKVIAYDTDKHRKLLDAIMKRVRLSRDKRAEQDEKWKKNEEEYLAYMTTKEVDQQRKEARRQGNPQYTTIHIPYSYGQLMAAHSFWTSALFGREPVFQFSGRHAEGEEGRLAVEALMEYQRQVGYMNVALYNWLLDAGRYGVGFVVPYWCEEYDYVAEYVDMPEMYLGLPVEGRTKRVKQIREVEGYHGNRLLNVRPQDALPDPRRSFSDIQSGEFFGYELAITWHELVKGWHEEEYYNLEWAKSVRAIGREDRGTPHQIYPDAEDLSSIDPELDMALFDAFTITIELIPKDWGLGTTTMPEKWVFTVLEDRLIIESRPQSDMHNKLPVAPVEYEIDGYALYKRGMMEILEPLNNTITWLFNSHFYNVRKALNDMFVYDPSRVMQADLKDPRPGKLIRLKPSAYGSDTRTAVTQLATVDVTQANMRDIVAVMEFGERISSVNSNMQGVANPRGRKTATEMRIASTASIGRQKTVLEYMSAMGFSPLATMMLQNTQQYYTLEKQFRIAGDNIRGQGASHINVTPEAIKGFYDFVPVVGESPADKFALASLWRDLMRDVASNQLIASTYNLPEMFGWVAQLAGLRNINRFRIQLTPDQAIRDALARGQVVPIGGQNGAAGRIAEVPGAAVRGGAGGGEVGSEGLSRPTQSSRVGPVA